MSNIVRWHPFREMANMQNMMDRFFEESWRPFFEERTLDWHTLALDVNETDSAYMVTTELPGVKAEDIQVKLDGDYLLIEGEIPEQVIENKDARSIMKERRYGKFSRRIRLPQPVKAEKIEAAYKDGVLHLTLPKTEAVQPKLIPVKVNSDKK